MVSKNSNNIIYVVDGVRTAIGSPYKSLKNFTAAQLAATIIKSLVRRNKLKKKDVSEVVLGGAVLAGMGQNLARHATLLAGLSVEVPSYSVSSACGGGLQSVILAFQSLFAGESDLGIAGGAESATHNPFIIERKKIDGYTKNDVVDSLENDGLRCHFTGKLMGELAENLAQEHKISREEQDFFSLGSHLRATLAQEKNKFEKEIVPVVLNEKNSFLEDDRPRQNLNLKTFELYSPVFKRRGTITAGNASVPCDGAAGVLLSTAAAMKKFRLKPSAKILGYVSVAIEPEKVFESSITAIKRCLKKCALTIDDIDLFEISESFAVQVILTAKKLKIPRKKVNIYGGDIALGHPLGAAGIRNLVTLVHSLHDNNYKRGLVCVSYGGGGAIAMVVEV